MYHLFMQHEYNTYAYLHAYMVHWYPQLLCMYVRMYMYIYIVSTGFIVYNIKAHAKTNDYVLETIIISNIGYIENYY